MFSEILQKQFSQIKDPLASIRYLKILRSLIFEVQCQSAKKRENYAPRKFGAIQYSIICCQPPSSWKCASVIPIPKVAKTSSTADFRPISLLPILSKVLECHFYLLINEYLSVSYPLSNCQWGFQSGKSTVLALLDTTYTWFQLLEKNEEVGAVFF